MPDRPNFDQKGLGEFQEDLLNKRHLLHLVLNWKSHAFCVAQEDMIQADVVAIICQAYT